MAEISFWERFCVSLRAWLIDHWRGSLSLADSFWINCFFVNLGAGIILRQLKLSPMGIVLFGIFSMGISVWQLVGLWRSAKRNERGQPFWSSIVKGLCVLNVVFFGLIVLLFVAGLFGGLEEGGFDLPIRRQPSSFF